MVLCKTTHVFENTTRRPRRNAQAEQKRTRKLFEHFDVLELGCRVK